jgi:zinc/manganese transport system permease protein
MIEILTFPLFQRSLLVGCIVGALLAFLGVFVVARRLSFFADAIGHSALTGIALGLLLGVNPFLGAVIFSLLVAVGIAATQHSTRLPLDTILGVFFAASVALGVILVQFTPAYQSNLISFLFGDILTVTQSDIVVSLLLAVVITGVSLWALKPLTALTFHRDLAHAEGVAVARYELLFLLMLAGTVALAIKLVGIVLVTAMVVIPAASAQYLARSLLSFFVISLVIGITATIIGMIMSAVLEISSGPSIVLVGAACFAFSLLLGQLRDKV